MASATADRLQIIVGAITTLSVDAIVNAANSALSGGGGVDGAIHHTAGPELLAECRTLGRCPTGEARITRGYRLPARWVIHAVGPVWRGGDQGEADLLARTYRASLDLAVAYAITTLAFPSISIGAYGFPIATAASIAVREITDFGTEHPSLVVTMCCFSDRDRAVYASAAATLR